MKEWQKALIGSNEPIYKAIGIIEETSIALVVDSNNFLLGVITRGNINESIENGISKNEKVKKIMNQDPLVAYIEEGYSALVGKMIKHKIRQIPLINKNKNVIGLELLDELIKPIFGAGFNYQLLNQPFTYCQDGLITIHNSDFIKDRLFLEAYTYGKKMGSWGNNDIHWRVYIACWAANYARLLDGDYVECGVNRGGLVRTVMHYIDFLNLEKKFYLMDTFCGLVEKYVTTNEKAYGIKPGGYDECYEFVQQSFKDFHNVIIIKGSIPETLVEVKTEKVSYLSIDMNCVIPEIAAAEFFWNKLVKGAVVLLDDYGWVNHIEQKKAFDEFALKKGIQILSLPTGQGMFFKPN